MIKRRQTASIFLHTHSIRQGLTTRESHIINTHPILSQIQEAEGERNDKLTELSRINDFYRLNTQY